MIGKIEYKWLAMFIVALGIFMSTLDSSIVNISLPTLTKYFSTDIATIEWVIMAYLLTITGLLLSIGRLADMHGRKPIFTLGFIMFTIGSALCAFSNTVGQLILFRVVQGIGAAMLMANGPAIITYVFPPTERGKALGLMGTVVSVGLMTGPVLGGFLIDFIGWRSIFYINIPIGIIATAMAMSILKKEATSKNQKFDFLGAVALFISLVSLLFALSKGQQIGWTSTYILLLFALFIAFIFIFLIVEYKATHPMMDLSLFKNQSFTASNISALISFIAMFAVTLLMPYYLENVLKYSPSKVGMVLISVPLVMSIIAPISGWISDKTNSYLLSSIGIAIASLSLYLLSGLDSNSDFRFIVIRLALLGLGMGLFQSPNNSIIMGSVPKERLSIAGGLMATMRNMGMVTGIAIAGAVYTSRLNYYLEHTGTVETIASISAFQDAYIVAALICAIGIMTSLLRG